MLRRLSYPKAADDICTRSADIFKNC